MLLELVSILMVVMVVCWLFDFNTLPSIVILTAIFVVAAVTIGFFIGIGIDFWHVAKPWLIANL